MRDLCSCRCGGIQNAVHEGGFDVQMGADGVPKFYDRPGDVTFLPSAAAFLLFDATLLLFGRVLKLVFDFACFVDRALVDAVGFFL